MIAEHTCRPFLAGRGPILGADFGPPKPIFVLHQIFMTDPLKSTRVN